MHLMVEAIPRAAGGKLVRGEAAYTAGQLRPLRSFSRTAPRRRAGAD